MPTSNVDHQVKRLAGLNNNDVDALKNIGANMENNLQYYEFSGMPGTISVLKQRKLATICRYLEKGNELTVNLVTSMAEI